MIENSLEPVNSKQNKDYPERDLRIDFMRGVVMFILIIVHTEFFSLYNFLAWERIGLVSGGEGFVILSGIVIGMVYRKKIIKSGWKEVTLKLIDRAFQLYKVNIFIILSIWLISLTGIFNTESVMTFNDRVSNHIYNLYPENVTIKEFIYNVLTLKIGPHQTQILGLYTFLILLTPISLFLLYNKRIGLLLTLSWVLYISNSLNNYSLTKSQFEYAFPLLTWQLIYLHGMSFGFYKSEIASFFEKSNYKKILLYLSFIFFIVFLFISQNNPNPNMPSYAKLSFIEPSIFNDMYKKYFLKNTLGIFRLLNYLVVLIVGFWALTKYWTKVNKYFGWFFIPIGQASLYVFILHVYAVMLISNFIPFNFNHNSLISNTIGHTIILFGLWLMVRNKMLYAWIPR